MSIESKALFTNALRQRLYDQLTAADLNKVLTALSDTLGNYTMDYIQPEDSGSDDLLGAFLGAISVEGRSPKTVERYRYILTRVMGAVRVPVRQVTVHHLRAYLSAEKARGIQDSTLESTRQVLASFFGWLRRERLIENDPMDNLGAIRVPKKLKTVLSPVDLDKLRFRSKSKRDAAIIAFLQSTGCRVSEMTQLDRTDVDLTRGECTVFGKGAKERTVYLSDVAVVLLRDYLAERTDDDPALFHSQRGRLTPCGVRTMLNTLGERAGVSGVHPHKFRRTLATGMIRHGMPIQEVAALLGHEKLDTTMKYVVMDKTEVKNSYRKFA